MITKKKDLTILFFDLSLKTHILARRNEDKSPIEYPHKEAIKMSFKTK